MAGVKEKKIKKIDEMLSLLRRNPIGNDSLIKSYEKEKEDLLGMIDRAAQYKLDRAADAKKAKELQTKTGMTEAESLAIITILGASGPTALLKSLALIKGLPSAIQFLPKLAKLGGKEAKKAYKSLKNAVDVARGKSKLTNITAAGGRGQSMVRKPTGQFGGAVNPKVARLAQGAVTAAKSRGLQTAAGAGAAVAGYLYANNASSPDKVRTSGTQPDYGTVNVGELTAVPLIDEMHMADIPIDSVELQEGRKATDKLSKDQKEAIYNIIAEPAFGRMLGLRRSAEEIERDVAITEALDAGNYDRVAELEKQYNSVPAEDSFGSLVDENSLTYRTRNYTPEEIDAALAQDSGSVLEDLQSLIGDIEHGTDSDSDLIAGANYNSGGTVAKKPRKKKKKANSGSSKNYTTQPRKPSRA